MRIIVFTAVEAERKAVLSGLSERSEQAFASFEVLLSGVGPVAAAVQASRTLTERVASGQRVDLVISAGIGGKFIDEEVEGLEAGETWLAERSILADGGAESRHGFLTLDALGFGNNIYTSDSALLQTFRSALDCQSGDVLTVSTATGTKTTTAKLKKRWPHAIIEAMEGFSVAAAAHDHGIPFIEFRAVSNRVGPRRRGEWKLEEALAGLRDAFARISQIDFANKTSKEETL
jgi:futalosine hydrolase